MQVYHVTPTRNLQSIYENGLTSPRNWAWRGINGARQLAKARREGKLYDGVNMVAHGGEPQSILKVDIPAELVDGSRITFGPVGPENIVFPKYFKPRTAE